MNFKIQTNADKRAVISYIEKLSDKKQYTVSVKLVRKKRSFCQNRLLWLWYGCISEDTGYSPNELHEYFKKEYLPPEFRTLFGKTVEIERSTTKLDTAQFTAYLDRIKSFASTELDVELPNPDDLYFEQFVENFRKWI